MSIPVFLNTMSSRVRALPIVILYLTSGCNLRCITCSYRHASENELTIEEYGLLAAELGSLGLRTVVYSGGEPLLRPDLRMICERFRAVGARQTLLTNGLLLRKRIPEIGEFLEEVIVSLDGPDRQTHDRIRGVASFETILDGIGETLRMQNPPAISIRCVVQKANFRTIGRMIDVAREAGVQRISFLAADMHSRAFFRPGSGDAADPGNVLLSHEEATEFKGIIEHIIREYEADIRNGFVSESPAKLRHLAEYFEACTGAVAFPRNHCNAPMVSSVITSTGDVLPCYFLPAAGNIRKTPLKVLLNNESFLRTRSGVSRYEYPECHRCVCTLRVRPLAALAGRF